VPILRKVKRARYLTNRERDGSSKVLVRAEISVFVYNVLEGDDDRRSDEGKGGAGSSDVNSLQNIMKWKARIRRSNRILID